MSYYDNEGKQPKATPEQNAEAAKEASTDYDLGKKASHAYLKAKNIEPYNTRVGLRGELLVPGYDFNGQVKLCQEIKENQDGSFFKGFTKHSKKSGTFYPTHTTDFLNKKGESYLETFHLTEGMATAHTVYQALGEGAVVLAAWDCWNLETVVALIRGYYPNAPIHIYADNDLWTENQKGEPWNIGQIQAEKIREETLNVKVLYPFFNTLKGKHTSDFNDMAREDGLKRVQDRIKSKYSYEPQPKPFRLEGFTVKELMARPPVHMEWIVHGAFAEGTLNLFAAASTAGKSVIMRQCVICVARGEPFLGHKTKKGKVLWLAMEEGEAYMRKHYEKLNFYTEEATENIKVVFKEQLNKSIKELGHRPKSTSEAYVEAVRQECLETKPALVIIDTLILFNRIKNSNDYSEVSDVLTPIRDVARETGASIVLAHHMNKGEGKGTKKVMGSDAFNASVDVTLGMEVDTKGDRWIWAVGRTDEPWTEKKIHWDNKKFWATIGGTKKDEEDNARFSKIKEALLHVDEANAMNYTELSDRSGMDKAKVKKLLEDIVASGEGWMGWKVNPKNKKSLLYWAIPEGNTNRFEGRSF